VQSLILDGRCDQVKESVDWLLDRMEEEEDTGWKVSVVALVLITLKTL